MEIRKSYKETLGAIKERIYKAQYQAFKAVNKELIGLYWDIGKIIVEMQGKDGWGKSTVEKLAKDLQVEFEGIRGFSPSNVWRMRSFYLSYKDNEKLAQLAREIGWGHNVRIIESCKNDLEREFYIKMTIREGWSRSTLREKIENQEYERWALKQTNFDEALPKSLARRGEVLVKDDYNFDFLLLEDEHKERDIEQQLMRDIRQFLAEMGPHFAFVGNQVKIEVNEEEFYIDLLFYHRILKCLIAIELKAGKFKPEYAGKMAFYLTALEEHEAFKEESPPIGIVVCKTKDRTLVEYTLKSINKPMGVATYKTYKDKKKLPKKMAKYLPSPEEIASRLSCLVE